jgi:hypothetical protein
MLLSILESEVRGATGDGRLAIGLTTTTVFKRKKYQRISVSMRRYGSTTEENGERSNKIFKRLGTQIGINELNVSREMDGYGYW